MLSKLQELNCLSPTFVDFLQSMEGYEDEGAYKPELPLSIDDAIDLSQRLALVCGHAHVLVRMIEGHTREYLTSDYEERDRASTSLLRRLELVLQSVRSTDRRVRDYQELRNLILEAWRALNLDHAGELLDRAIAESKKTLRTLRGYE